MTDLKTKENLIFFLQSGNLRLNKSDLRFIRNLLNIISLKKPITSNQSKLVDHLIQKYQKQLAKHNLSIDAISAWPWTTEIVDSSESYTGAYVSILNGNIYFKAPFNKTFISKHKNITMSPFLWDKDKKYYEAPFSTRALKIILNLANDVYEIINFCPEVSRLLNTTKEYQDASLWKPTLVRTGSSYLISGINEVLYEKTKEVVLDASPYCVSRLTDLGIEIDIAILDDNELLAIASKKILSLNIADTDKLVDALVSIKCDAIIFSWHTFYSGVRERISTKLKEHNIQVIDNAKHVDDAFEYPVHVFFINSAFTVDSHSSRIKKHIKLTNSNPIDVK